jgi:ribosomal protein S18 acetylase RimI-like enzyme
MADEQILIRPIDKANRTECEAAARLMSSTEPWITLGRKFENTINAVTSAHFDVCIALVGEMVVGVIIFTLHVPLIRGYIAALAVHKDWRSRGVGSKLLRCVEERILRESPNVFLCVSSFNPNARRFYERNGYTQCGELKGYVIAGASEILMRKTTGPTSTFVSKK